MAVNDNEPLSPIETLAENILDDLLAEAALDEDEGPIEPRLALIEIAARAVARAVLEHGADPYDAAELAQWRAGKIMLEVVDRQDTKLPTTLTLVEN